MTQWGKLEDWGDEPSLSVRARALHRGGASLGLHHLPAVGTDSLDRRPALYDLIALLTLEKHDLQPCA
jgi:hypothetical protein